MLRIRKATNYILTKLHSNQFISPPQISVMWTNQFLDCNPKFNKKKQKLLVVECKNAHNEKDFWECFEKYKVIHIEKRFSNDNI